MGGFLTVMISTRAALTVENKKCGEKENQGFGLDSWVKVAWHDMASRGAKRRISVTHSCRVLRPNQRTKKVCIWEKVKKMALGQHFFFLFFLLMHEKLVCLIRLSIFPFTNHGFVVEAKVNNTTASVVTGRSSSNNSSNTTTTGKVRTRSCRTIRYRNM